MHNFTVAIISGSYMFSATKYTRKLCTYSLQVISGRDFD